MVGWNEYLGANKQRRDTEDQAFAESMYGPLGGNDSGNRTANRWLARNEILVGGETIILS